MQNGFYYLAIPYTGNEEQRKYRFELSLNAAAEFMRQNIYVFAPIIYSTQILEKLEPLSLTERRNIIMPYLLELLRASKGLILITADGWQDSWGIQQELNFCQANQLPVYKISPEQISSNMAHIFTERGDQ